MTMNAHFAKALETLEDMLAEEASKVERAVHSAVAAVESASTDSAYLVVYNDQEIDDSEIEIEEECLKILALHQPVASDLRRVITILKVNNELERAGDLAANIAERVADISSYQSEEIEKLDFGDMVMKASGMLERALDSLTYRDAAAAEAVILGDDAVDAIHRNNYAVFREKMIAHPAEAQYYMNGLTVSRCLERIADIATNIAEDVIYLETGRIVRHRHEGEDNGK